MRTYERIREHGTYEVIGCNPQDRIAAIRRILEERQYAKIDGTMIDGFSASLILSVYDQLNESNRLKFASMPAGRMGLVAYELMERLDRRGPAMRQETCK